MRLSKRGTINWASTPQRKLPPPPSVMTVEEFRLLCGRLSINDSNTASELLGPHWRTCQKYWYGEMAVPVTLARLLRLAVAHNSSHDDLRRIAGTDSRLRNCA